MSNNKKEVGVKPLNYRATLFTESEQPIMTPERESEIKDAFSGTGLTTKEAKVVTYTVQPSGTSHSETPLIQLVEEGKSLVVINKPGRLDIECRQDVACIDDFVDLVQNIMTHWGQIYNGEYKRIALATTIMFDLNDEDRYNAYTRITNNVDENPFEWSLNRVFEFTLKGTAVRVNDYNTISCKPLIINNKRDSRVLLMTEINTVLGQSSEAVMSCIDSFWTEASAFMKDKISEVTQKIQCE